MSSTSQLVAQIALLRNALSEQRTAHRNATNAMDAGGLNLTDDAMRAMFEAYDVNGDGRIEMSELDEVMAGLGKELTAAELTRIMSETDSDGDGAVTFDEVRHDDMASTCHTHPTSARAALARRPPLRVRLLVALPLLAVSCSLARRLSHVSCF